MRRSADSFVRSFAWVRAIHYNPICSNFQTEIPRRHEGELGEDAHRRVTRSMRRTLALSPQVINFYNPVTELSDRYLRGYLLGANILFMKFVSKTLHVKRSVAILYARFLTYGMLVC